MFNRRIETCKTADLKHAVECCDLVKFKPSKSDAEKRLLWCGLSSGDVQIVNFDTGEILQRLPLHKQIVTCLLQTAHTEMWSASFDRTLKVTNIKTKKTRMTLTAHKDAVLVMSEGANDTIWTGSLNGQLLQWNAKTGSLLSSADFVLRSAWSGRVLPVYSLQFMPDDDRLWIGTGRSIVVLDPKTWQVQYRLPSLGTTPSQETGGAGGGAGFVTSPRGQRSGSTDSRSGSFGGGSSMSSMQAARQAAQARKAAGVDNFGNNRVNSPVVVGVGGSASARSRRTNSMPSMAARPKPMLPTGVNRGPVVMSEPRRNADQGFGGFGSGGSRGGLGLVANKGPVLKGPGPSPSRPFKAFVPLTPQVATDLPSVVRRTGKKLQFPEGAFPAPAGGGLPGARVGFDVGRPEPAPFATPPPKAFGDNGRRSSNTSIGFNSGVGVSGFAGRRSSSSSAGFRGGSDGGGGGGGGGGSGGSAFNASGAGAAYQQQQQQQEQSAQRQMYPGSPGSGGIFSGSMGGDSAYGESPGMRPRAHSATSVVSRDLAMASYRRSRTGTGSTSSVGGGGGSSSSGGGGGGRGGYRDSRSTNSSSSSMMSYASAAAGKGNDEKTMWGGGGAASHNSPPKQTWAGRFNGGLGKKPKATAQALPTAVVAPAPFPEYAAASHCVVPGPAGELWSSSERCGVVQVWCTATHQLLHHWDLDACPGVNHLIYSRGCIWAAAANGSVYVFDAVTKDPLVELRVHSDAARSLFIISKEHLISTSGSKDSSIGVMLNMPRGRLYTEEGATRLAVIDTYDRYGFVNLPGMEGNDGAGEEDTSFAIEMVLSLDTTASEELQKKSRRREAHIDAWESHLKALADGVESGGEGDDGGDGDTTPKKGSSGGATEGGTGMRPPPGFSGSVPTATSRPAPFSGTRWAGARAEAPSVGTSASAQAEEESADSYPKLTRSPATERLIRAGIPNKCRQEVWGKMINLWVGDIRKAVGPDYYNRLWDLQDKDIKPMPPTGFLKQVDLDLLRTFPTNKYFQRDGPAINKLRRVLVAFMRHSPRVGYCQGFNFLAGFALLFVSEEMAFWCLTAIIDHIMPKSYFIDPMTESRADQPVLREIVEEHIPEIEEVLVQQNFDLSLVTFNWFFTLYVETVPIDVTLRIWDQLLYEGDFVLFRAAYSLLLIDKGTVAGLDSPGEVFDAMRNLGKQCSNVDELFFLVNNECPFTKEDVAERRQFHKTGLLESDAVIMKQVKAQLAKRKAAREAKARADRAASDAAAGLVSDVCACSPQDHKCSKPGCPGTKPAATQPMDIVDSNTVDAGFAMPSAATAPLVEQGESAWALPPASSYESSDAPELQTPTTTKGKEMMEEIFEQRLRSGGSNASAVSQAALSARGSPTGSFDDDLEVHRVEHDGGYRDRDSENSSPYGSTGPTSPFESTNPSPETGRNRSLSRLSVDSWVQVDVEEVGESAKPKPQAQEFVTKVASDFAFTPKMTGGTGDGRLVLGPQSASLSIGLFLDTRLPARRRPVHRKLPGSSSSSSKRRANRGRANTDNSARNTDDEASSDSRSASSSQAATYSSRHNSNEGEMREPTRAVDPKTPTSNINMSNLGGAMMKPKPFQVSPAADDFPPLSSGSGSSSGRSVGAAVAAVAAVVEVPDVAGSAGPPPLLTRVEADAKWNDEVKAAQLERGLMSDGGGDDVNPQPPAEDSSGGGR